MVRLLIPFIMGIFAALLYGYSGCCLGKVATWSIPGLILLYLADYLFNRMYRWRWVTGIIINLAFTLVGFQLTQARIYEDHHNKTSCVLPGEEVICKAYVSGKVKKKASTVQAILTLTKLHHDTSRKVNCKVLAYFRKDAVAEGLQYGDKVLFKAKLREIESPKNPEEFDYKRYLNLKSVNLVVFIDSTDWMNRGRGGNPLKLMASRLRKFSLDILRDQGLSGAEYAIASALLLGVKDELDRELYQAFAGAGAIHILCVSGLHVGVIFIIISKVLAFLRRSRSGMVLRVFIILTVIWSYAMITGLSPSVLRASAMFSIMSIGGSLRRTVPVFNSLAASAFLLLEINPFYLADVGFQLSYLAVTGILAFQKRIYRLWLPTNIFIDRVWQIITVSISAQLGTIPVSLFYFHQFPNYFLLTNILVIPLSGLVIYLGLITISSSYIPGFSYISAHALKFLLRLLNNAVHLVNSIPGSVTEGIYLSKGDVVLWYVIMISSSLFLIRKNKRAFLLTLTLVITLISITTIRKSVQLQQKKLIVYRIRGHTAFDLIHGHQAYFFCDEDLAAEPGLAEYATRNYRIKNGITEVKKRILGKELEIREKQLYVDEYFIQFFGKRLLVSSQETPVLPLRGIPVDYLLVTGAVKPPIIPPGQRQRGTYAAQVLLDASIPGYLANVWIKACADQSISCYNIHDQGAFEIDISSSGY